MKNNGIVPQYYIENDHEAIIPKELFYRVQEEKARRAAIYKPAVKRKNGLQKENTAGNTFCLIFSTVENADSLTADRYGQSMAKNRRFGDVTIG